MSIFSHWAAKSWTNRFAAVIAVLPQVSPVLRSIGPIVGQPDSVNHAADFIDSVAPILAAPGAGEAAVGIAVLMAALRFKTQIAPSK